MVQTHLSFELFNQYTASIGLRAALADPHNVEFKKMSILSQSMLARYLTAPPSEQLEVLDLVEKALQQTLESLQVSLELFQAEKELVISKTSPLSNAES